MPLSGVSSLRQQPTTLESAMNIELDEVVAQDVSDEALERAAGGAQGQPTHPNTSKYVGCAGC